MDPLLGRFTSPDSIVPNPGNPLDWDRYSYVRNNPVLYTDPTGHAADCGIDKGSCASQQAQPFYTSPDKVESALEFAGDFLGTALGLYEPIDWVITISDGFQWYDAAGLLPVIPGSLSRKIDNYVDIKKLVDGLGYQVHHLIEVRFARSLGLDPKNIPSVALTKEQHQVITNTWRKYIGYSKDKREITTQTATVEDIWEAALNIYGNAPEWLSAVKDLLGK